MQNYRVRLQDSGASECHRMQRWTASETLEEIRSLKWGSGDTC